MTLLEQLEKFVPDRVERPENMSDLESGIFYVYILSVDDVPIVVGHGKRNRARVIFDTVTSVTPNHIKAMTVRLHLLFGRDGAAFERYVIRCDSKREAAEIEAAIHGTLGGNKLDVPEALLDRLFRGLDDHPMSQMVLKMALCSSFDGLADLRRWRKKGILEDTVWEPIEDILILRYDE